MFRDARRTGARVRNLIPFIVLATFVGIASAADVEKITFQNDLSACVAIKETKTATASNVVLANTTIQLRKPIGECGCLSALATYTSSVNRAGVRQILQEGLVGLKSGGEKSLVLATEPALVTNKAVQVRLACAGPS
ncbi:DUF2195 family protein [Cupriavidus campinensis]|uniref:DUF2195 family protein n=1 Tax=Cupriavidus campinensis TaxID=151783 RepID=A0ABY3EL75_9BURK|nr:DUF2195 family protein [Cupriavidus campinensis]